MKTGGQFTLGETAGCQKIFVKNSDTHVKILSDNTATVHGINKIGSDNSNTCHKIICDTRDWVEQNNIWLTAAHIPSKYEVKLFASH